MDHFFDYGVITYNHRFSIKRSFNDYTVTTLNKCIRIGLDLKSKTLKHDVLFYELQIVYKDETDNLQCLCLDLHDWCINIVHLGDMQFNI